jgi:hypothetical protein
MGQRRQIVKVSKWQFEGTPEEFRKVASLLGDHRGSEGGADVGDDRSDRDERANADMVDPPGLTDGDVVSVDAVRRMLTRIPIPDGQRALYRVLRDAGDQWVSRADLAAGMGRTERELDGVLGALGRRTNGTPGCDKVSTPGIAVILEVRFFDNQWHYRMRPVLRAALDAERL